MGYDLVNPYSLLLLANAVFTFGLAAFATQLRASTETRSVAALLAGAGIWSVADALRIAAETPGQVIFWNKCSYIGVVIIAPAVLAFAAAYADQDRWLGRRRFGAVVLASVGALVTVFTNQWHGLWRVDETISPGSVPVLTEELGLLHLVWSTYVLFGVMPLTILFIGGELRNDRRSPLFRRQSLLLLLAIAAPLLTSTLFTMRVLTFDLTPFANGVFGVVVLVGVVRYRLLDVTPIGRDAVLENMDSGALVVDGGHRVVDANARAAEVLGRSADALVGVQFEDLVAGTPVSADQVLREEPDELVVDVTVDGETSHYEIRATAVTSGRRTLGRVVLFSDVTEQVRRKRELERRTEDLERQNERLDDFAGIVSHDLRNPIQVIESNLTLLEVTDDEQVERVERIERATDRMHGLVDDLLTLARSGQAIQETEPVPLVTVVARAWDTVATAGADLEVEASGTLEAEPDRLRQLFENLFRNAIEHGVPGEPGAKTDGGRGGDLADLTVTVDDTEGGFFVADDGRGLLVDDLPLSGPEVTDELDGGGYGLRIVRTIAEAHGWEMRVDESADGGARFEFLT